MSPEKTRLSIAIIGGQKEVECAWKGAAWAVTKSPDLPGWKVTHIRTGRAIPVLNDDNLDAIRKNKAVKIAQALEKELGEPWPASAPNEAPSTNEVREKIENIRDRFR